MLGKIYILLFSMNENNPHVALKDRISLAAPLYKQTQQRASDFPPSREVNAPKLQGFLLLLVFKKLMLRKYSQNRKSWSVEHGSAKRFSWKFHSVRSLFDGCGCDGSHSAWCGSTGVLSGQRLWGEDHPEVERTSADLRDHHSVRGTTNTTLTILLAWQST